MTPVRGGTDARTVPAAALAWVTAVVVTATTARGAAVAAATLLGVVAAVAGVRVVRASGRWTAGSGSVRQLGVMSAPAPPGEVGTWVGTVVLALLAAGAVALSGAVQLTQREHVQTVLARTDVPVVLEGRVVGDPRPVGSFGTFIEIRLHAVIAGGGAAEAHHAGPQRAAVPPVPVLLRGASEWQGIEHGTVVRTDGALTALQGERALVEVRAGPPLVVRPAQGSAAVVNDLRSGLVAAVDRLPPDSRGLVPGTAVGDTRALPADLRQAMRDTSLVHVTAVSGAHFSVVLAALLGLGAVLRLPLAIRVPLTLAGVVGFAVLVHPGPAVLRAAVMGAVVVVGLVLGRPSRAVPALGWAVIGLVCWDPWTARDLGFHLSVAATAAIVLLAPALARRLPGPRPLRTAVAVSAAAQAACGPLLLTLDPVLPLYAVPANVLAVPALLPATLGGLLATVTGGAMPWFSGPGLFVADVSVRWLAGVSRGFAALPGARLPWPEGPGGAVLLTLLTALALVVVLSRPPRDERR